MSDGLVVGIATVILIALSAFFVVIEFALLGARRHRLEATAATDRSARAALRVRSDQPTQQCCFAYGARHRFVVDELGLRPPNST